MYKSGSGRFSMKSTFEKLLKCCVALIFAVPNFERERYPRVGSTNASLGYAYNIYTQACVCGLPLSIRERSMAAMKGARGSTGGAY